MHPLSRFLSLSLFHYLSFLAPDCDCTACYLSPTSPSLPAPFLPSSGIFGNWRFLLSTGDPQQVGKQAARSKDGGKKRERERERIVGMHFTFRRRYEAYNSIHHEPWSNVRGGREKLHRIIVFPPFFLVNISITEMRLPRILLLLFLSLTGKRSLPVIPVVVVVFPFFFPSQLLTSFSRTKRRGTEKMILNAWRHASNGEEAGRKGEKGRGEKCTSL